MGIDVENLDKDEPKYESQVPRTADQPSVETVDVKFRRFKTDSPLLAKVNADLTVGQVEKKIAENRNWNERMVRFYHDGKAISKNARIGDVVRQLGDNAVFDTVPETYVGSEEIRLPKDLPQPLSSHVRRFVNQTDFVRIKTELMDMKAKQGYGSWFKVEIESVNATGFMFPVVKIFFRGRWYTHRLILAGYPAHIKGYFVGGIPPCPVHGGKHPHIHYTSDMCWAIEQEWKVNHELYRDYIAFLKGVLDNPRHHIGCGH